MRIIVCEIVFGVALYAVYRLPTLLTYLTIAILWAAPHIWKGTIWVTVNGGRGVYLGAVFAFYLAEEWRRGSHEQLAGEDKSEQNNAEEERDPYEAALTRFGLSPFLTQADLKRAYQQAIRKAHPDKGGSLAEAQAINAARDLIARRHGWK